jgi:hypothetical protein
MNETNLDGGITDLQTSNKRLSDELLDFIEEVGFQHVTGKKFLNPRGTDKTLLFKIEQEDQKETDDIITTAYNIVVLSEINNFIKTENPEDGVNNPVIKQFIDNIRENYNRIYTNLKLMSIVSKENQNNEEKKERLNIQLDGITNSGWTNNNNGEKKKQINEKLEQLNTNGEKLKERFNTLKKQTKDWYQLIQDVKSDFDKSGNIKRNVGEEQRTSSLYQVKRILDKKKDYFKIALKDQEERKKLLEKNLKNIRQKKEQVMEKNRKIREDLLKATEQYNEEKERKKKKNPIAEPTVTTMAMNKGETIEGKHGDYEIVDDEEVDLTKDKTNLETIKYKHHEQGEKGVTIPFKVKTKEFEERFLSLSIKELNDFIIEDVTQAKKKENPEIIVFKDGLFKYQYIKYKNATYDCINIIDTNQNKNNTGNEYATKIINQITGIEARGNWSKKQYDHQMNDFVTKMKTENKIEITAPKARIFLKYNDKDLGTPIVYDDNLDDEYQWRIYPINPLKQNLQTLEYVDHPFFYIKMKKNDGGWELDGEGEILTEYEYKDRLIKDGDEDGELIDFLDTLGSAILIDSWRKFCKSLDNDSCKLYKLCKVDGNKCELNENELNPYVQLEGKKNLKLTRPEPAELEKAWNTFWPTENHWITNITTVLTDKNNVINKIDEIIADYTKRVNQATIGGRFNQYLTDLKLIYKENDKKVVNEIINQIKSMDSNKIYEIIDEILKEKISKTEVKDLEDYFDIFSVNKDKFKDSNAALKEKVEEHQKKLLTGETIYYNQIADEIKKIPEIMRKEYNLLNTNIHDEVLKTIVLSIDLYNLLYEEVVEETKQYNDIKKTFDNHTNTKNENTESTDMKIYNEKYTNYKNLLDDRRKKINKNISELKNRIDKINNDNKFKEIKKILGYVDINKIQPLPQNITQLPVTAGKGPFLEKDMKKQKEKEIKTRKEERKREKQWKSIEKFNEEQKKIKTQLNEIGKNAKYITGILDVLEEGIQLQDDHSFTIPNTITIKRNQKERDIQSVIDAFKSAFEDEFEELDSEYHYTNNGNDPVAKKKEEEGLTIIHKGNYKTHKQLLKDKEDIDEILTDINARKFTDLYDELKQTYDNWWKKQRGIINTTVINPPAPTTPLEPITKKK